MYRLKKKLLTICRSGKLIALLAITDQSSKWLVNDYLSQNTASSIKISSFLELIGSWNAGISFGLFKNYHQSSNQGFTVLNSLIISYLWRVMLKHQSLLSFWGYSCIIGGAVSNVTDRLLKGAVFDFIYFHYLNYQWPVFNLADSFICAGAALLIYDYSRSKKSY